MELDVNTIEQKLAAIIENVLNEVNEDAKKPNGDETPVVPETQQPTLDPSPPPFATTKW